MKKILTIATMLLIGITASAQLQVGAGFMYEMIQSDNSANLSGLYAGASYNIKIAGNFGVAPGVYYTIANKKGANLWGFGEKNVTDHNVIVPIYLNYSIPVGRDASFFIFAGPTADLGIAYNVKETISTKGRVIIDGDSGNLYAGDDPLIPRFDVKAGGGVGFKYNHYVFSVGYDYGILERNNSHFNLLHAGFAYSF